MQKKIIKKYCWNKEKLKSQKNVKLGKSKYKEISCLFYYKHAFFLLNKKNKNNVTKEKFYRIEKNRKKLKKI